MFYMTVKTVLLYTLRHEM